MYRMSHKLLSKQKVEYLGHSLTKRAEIFAVGRKVLTVPIYIERVENIYMERVKKDQFRLRNTKTQQVAECCSYHSEITFHSTLTSNATIWEGKLFSFDPYIVELCDLFSAEVRRIFLGAWKLTIWLVTAPKPVNTEILSLADSSTYVCFSFEKRRVMKRSFKIPLSSQNFDKLNFDNIDSFKRKANINTRVSERQYLCIDRFWSGYQPYGQFPSSQENTPNFCRKQVTELDYVRIERE